jgi:hypothetical protein
MAKKKRSRAVSNDPAEKSWIDDLAFDPAEHPDARALVGYVGKSPDPKSLRLYMSLDLHDYLEIRESDILDQKILGGEKDAPRTTIWVKGTAQVKEVQILTLLEAQARFLSGSITDQYLHAARGGLPPDFSRLARVTTVPGTTMTCMSFCVQCGSFVCGGPTRFE